MSQPDAPRVATSRANSARSTGSRTESGKQRFSQKCHRDSTGPRNGQHRVAPKPHSICRAELLSQNPNPQTLIPLLSTLGLHSGRLSRQFQKASEHLREIQEERRRLERRHLNDVAEILIHHQRKGLPFDPSAFSKEAGFVFSKEQIERHAQHLVLNPALTPCATI